MLCNKCTEKPKTAADLDRCSICRSDGTANEVPKDMPRKTPLELVLERKPGLAARFTPEPTPPAEPEAAAVGPVRRAKKSR